MKKIPTLFERTFEGHKIVGITDKITPGCEDAFKNGLATVKYDGSCCASYTGYTNLCECNDGADADTACERCWNREMPDMKIDRTDEYERQAEEFGKVCVAVGKKIHHIDPINRLQIALAIYLKVNSK